VSPRWACPLREPPPAKRAFHQWCPDGRSTLVDAAAGRAVIATGTGTGGGWAHAPHTLPA
jgi:hypothetical protein